MFNVALIAGRAAVGFDQRHLQTHHVAIVLLNLLNQWRNKVHAEFCRCLVEITWLLGTSLSI
jgi:hypothetical protein